LFISKQAIPKQAILEMCSILKMILYFYNSCDFKIFKIWTGYFRNNYILP